jgi:NAD(P)-dependent dehydrogenase (short-subunit alcohol dehydrogenase family)
MRFSDRVAVVTGAGRGIGNATALAFAGEGATVVLIARHDEEIAKTTKDITAGGGSAVARIADVEDPIAMAAVVDEAIAEFGRIDILVTCAATTPAVGPSESLPLADWQRVIAVDLTGTFISCQAVATVMLGQRYGRIVNLASFHVAATYPERAAYAAAKSGVIGLTQALAVEWSGRGVTVNAVAPGPIVTPRTSWFLSQDPASEAGMIARTPAGRLGEPADVAQAILYLCSDGARHVSGQTLVVDGAWTKNAWWGTHPFKG